MPAFTVAAGFPLGEFNAHGAGESPEWPPAPARLAAAILSVAHREGMGVATAERLFALGAPTISAPRAGLRDIGFGRWVPVNNELRIDASGAAVGIVDARDRFGQKAQKTPERGVVIGTGPDDVVRWVYEDDRDLIDVDELGRLVRGVEYLGRPTSPVIIDVAPGRDLGPETGTRWVPDELGDVELRVATPELLRALDAREEQRRRSHVTGTHPALDVRPVARYRTVGGEPTRAAAGPSVRDILDGTVLFRFPAGADGVPELLADDAAIVVDQLLGALNEAVWALPLFGTTGRRETPVLRGVLIRARGSRTPVAVAVRSGVVTARPAEPRSLASLSRVIRSACAPSAEWTTLIPVTLGDDEVCTELESTASRLGARLSWAGVHDAAQAGVGPDTDGMSGSRQVSAVFDREVPGPLFLERIWMVPVGAAGLAVNGMRPSVR